MNIIPYAGAVMGRIVVTKYRQLFQFADRDFGDIRHEIVRDAGRVFADQAGGMSPDRIKVAQEHDAPFRISGSLAFQDLFDHIFGPAVRIGAAGGGHAFPVGNDRLIAVNRGGGGKNDLLAAMRLHDFTERQGCIQIVSVIPQRLGNTFADGFQTRKMNNAVETVLVKNPIQGIFVCNIRFIMGNRMSDDLFNPSDGFG